ncbi:hypothetical protein PR202_gb22074 [Eleusine coracana subsp. coracana]|uniref:Peptidylprolyl isomerase n=1 Tax=Eleusine coracana subsp. coracana TaxID=191504 RepID=A0AAV5FES9_ELECO|nr:hypothetical protein PR202_gb22074 [Eleusine coracana subsp. coracana]
MFGLRARVAAQLPCPSQSPSSAPTTSLARFARLSTVTLAPPASAPPPARAPPPSSLSSRWGQAMSPGGTVGKSRPTTRVFCTAAGSVPREGKELLVQHLLVGEKDVRLLVDLEKSIVAGGADLSDLAVEHSLCPSKENGGMLGWIRKGQMVPEFEEAAFGAPLNKVVRCKTKFGWHLLQVLAERDQCILQDIEPEVLHSKMQDPSFIEEVQLIDVREPDEVYTVMMTGFIFVAVHSYDIKVAFLYLLHGRAKSSLPGFKVLPLRQFGTWGPVMTDEFNPEKDTYVLCHHGMRSMQVAKWLQSQGFRKVYNVAGGIHAYALKADSSIPTY